MAAPRVGRWLAVLCLAAGFVHRGWTSSPGESVPSAPRGLLFLATGDRLTCTLQSYDATSGMLSVSAEPTIVAPITFSADSLLRYFNTAPPASRATHEWTLELQNGDRIDGDGLALDETAATIRHASMGELRVPRSAIAAVQSTRKPTIIYEGPIWGEEWIVNGRSESLSRPAIILEAPGRELWAKKIGPWPDPFVLDLTIRGLSASEQLTVLIQSDKIGATAGEITQGYLLAVQGGVICNLLKRIPSGVNIIGSTPIRAPGPPSARENIRLRLYGDKAGQRFILMRGDRKIAEWTDAAEAVRGGPYLVLHSTGSAVLTALQIARWNGQSPDEQTHTPPLDRERVTLLNEDVIVGDLKATAASQVTMATAFGALSIPLERIERIEFRGAGRGVHDGAGARVTLETHTHLRLQPEEIRDGYLKGRNPVIGTVRVPLAAVRSIVWKESSAEGLNDE